MTAAALGSLLEQHYADAAPLVRRRAWSTHAPTSPAWQRGPNKAL